MRRIATANHETERRDSQNLKRVIRAVLALLVMASLMITTVCAAAAPGTTGTEDPAPTSSTPATDDPAPTASTPATDDPAPTPSATVKDCTLDIHFVADGKPIPNVNFKLYRVAYVNLEDKTFGMLDDFKYNINMHPEDWATEAKTLKGKVERDKKPVYATAKTNAKGIASFKDLETGVYLVVGSKSGDIDGNTYTPAESLLTLPAFNELTNDWTNKELAVKVKSQTKEVIPPKPGGPPDPETISIRALKEWVGDENAKDARPDSVTVDLMKDGEIYDTVELSEDNKWRHDWEELDKSAEWEVVERDLRNYNVTVKEDGVTQTITNTYVPPTNIPDDDPPRVEPSPRPSPSPTPPIDVDDPDVPLDPGATPEPSVPPEVDVGDPEIPLDPGITPDPIAPLPDDPPIDAGDPDVPMDPGFPTVPNDPVITEVPDETPPLVEMLPQTGMLWWPVPIMALLGAALILLGSLRRRSR